MEKENKILNNTCVEVLPSLLDQSKVRTTRAAFTKHITRKSTQEDCQICDEPPNCGTKPLPCNIEIERENQKKPAKFKVGDKVKMIWDNESRNQQFCKTCGNPIINGRLWDLCTCDDEEGMIKFNKNLGVVEILSVEKITIRKIKDNNYMILDNKLLNEKKPSRYNQDQFAKEEGFVDVNKMFEYFDKFADLSTEKEFWTYTFVWLSKENSNEKIQV